MGYSFDAKDAKEKCVQWVRDWFEENGKGCMAVIGMSGGKDSTVAAAICKEALGKDRVFGVLMPNGTQPDIHMAYAVCRYLGIQHTEINIEKACEHIRNEVKLALTDFSRQAETNLPARVRMTTLYAVSQTLGGRVVNTCNCSEDYIGYSTRYGDSAGDFAPLAGFTVEEVKAVGRVLGLPDEFIDKAPSDGLCGLDDEDNLGFSYQTLDDYLRRGILPEGATKQKIDALHEKNLFKLRLMPMFVYVQKEPTKQVSPHD